MSFHTNLFLECGPNQFECDSGKCIAMTQRCDGKNDCNTNEEDSDFSDEEFCKCTYHIGNKNYVKRLYSINL